MVSQVITWTRDMVASSHISYSGATRERGRIKAESTHLVALLICVFFLLISLGLAIWFGYQGSIWLSIAALGPFFASFMAALCVRAKTTK